jgi:hypothetical protein
VNGDGFDDVVIGGPFEDEDNAGRVYGYYGSATGLSKSSIPDWTAVNDSKGSLFGNSVATAGDVNGDGFDDVIVGAPQYDTGDTEAGEARVYLGSAAGLEATPIWTAYGEQRFAWFGYSVGTAGDVNGDGYDDIIVGSPSAALGGDQTVYAYYGSAVGLSDSPDWIVTQSGEDALATFGRSVGTAGDVNGDGFDDVILGDAGINFQAGAAYVYCGSPNGLRTFPDWTAIGDPGGGAQLFGQSVGTAGDVNGDGFSDVIVGASAYGSMQGRAYLYYGSAGGLRVNPALRVKNSQQNAELGYSVGTAGDVDGDGLDDMIVGAPLYDYFEFREGLAVAYYGRRPPLH